MKNMSESLNESNNRLERLKPVLVCPKCKGNLLFKSDKGLCEHCSVIYPIQNGKIYFVNVPERKDKLDDLKGFLKKCLGIYYYKIGVNIFAPTYPLNFSALVKERLNPLTQLIIDVGSGNNRLDENIICLDLFDYNAVDIVCDLNCLPFQFDSIDAFISRSVLEHVINPIEIVRHFYECTKKGGLTIHLIPFLFPFHASPHDFQRYTYKGQNILFKDWEIIEQFNATGPVTLFLLCFIEFMSIIFSFGHQKLKAYIYLFGCALLFPFKYLDVFFINRKSFLTLAPSILVTARKK